MHDLAHDLSIDNLANFARLSNLTIGMSGTAIEPSIAGHCLDGIGITTLQLMQSLRLDYGLDIRPIAFPKLSFLKLSKFGACGSFWPYPFPLMTAASLLIGKTFQPKRKKIDNKTNFCLYHSLDYRIPKLKCPVIASLHDATLLKYPHWIRSRYHSIKGQIVHSTIRFANHIIALSHAMIPDLVEYFGVREENITVVPLGVDNSWFIQKSIQEIENVLTHYGIPKNYILFVGTLQPRKNILRMLKAYKLLPPTVREKHKLVMVGREGWNTEDFMPVLKELRSKGELIWTQYIPKNALQCLYQAANCFLFPSLYEGFGLPLLEAFASRVPVITSDIASLREVSQGAAITVDPESIEEITTAILKMLGSDDSDSGQLRKSCIEKGFVRAKEMTWSACAKKTIQVYSQFF